MMEKRSNVVQPHLFSMLVKNNNEICSHYNNCTLFLPAVRVSSIILLNYKLTFECLFFNYDFIMFKFGF